MSRAAALALAVLLCALAAAGCGGSSSTTTSAAPPPATTGSTPPVTTTGPVVPSPETVTGILPPDKAESPFAAALVAAGHRPVAGEQWSFTVKAKNKDGSPTTGTVRAILLLNGQVYDTIGWFGFDGELTRPVTFPLERKDLPLMFQAQVIANGGVTNLNYPLKVR